MRDDYGEEPSWPVAIVIGALAFVVGVIVGVRDCLGGLFRRRGPKDEDPEDR